MGLVVLFAALVPHEGLRFRNEVRSPAGRNQLTDHLQDQQLIADPLHLRAVCAVIREANDQDLAVAGEALARRGIEEQPLGHERSTGVEVHGELNVPRTVRILGVVEHGADTTRRPLALDALDLQVKTIHRELLLGRQRSEEIDQIPACFLAPEDRDDVPGSGEDERCPFVQGLLSP